MNERERWIVYPLLFLALGASLRDKLFHTTSSKQIECEELRVVGDDRGARETVPLVVMGAAQQTAAGGRPVGVMEVAGDISARTVYAENFVYRGIPFGPAMLRGLPGISPSDWLRALQQSAAASNGGAPGEDNIAKPQDPNAAPSEPPADDAGKRPVE